MRAGYVGLVTGACLAHVEHRVCMFRDVEQRVVPLEEGLPGDGRDALDPGAAAAAGLLYRGFGRG